MKYNSKIKICKETCQYNNNKTKACQTKVICINVNNFSNKNADYHNILKQFDKGRLSLNK